MNTGANEVCTAWEEKSQNRLEKSWANQLLQLALLLSEALNDP